MKTAPGVMVRQTPPDVVEWTVVSSGGFAGPEGEGAFWLSTDYSDYNSEHTLYKMALLDRVGAEYWADETSGANRDKAHAHYWNCAGRHRSVIEYGKASYLATVPGMRSDEKHTVYVANGFFSGSRTIARDKT